MKIVQRGLSAGKVAGQRPVSHAVPSSPLLDETAMEGFPPHLEAVRHPFSSYRE